MRFPFGIFDRVRSDAGVTVGFRGRTVSFTFSGANVNNLPTMQLLAEVWPGIRSVDRHVDGLVVCKKEKKTQKEARL